MWVSELFLTPQFSFLLRFKDFYGPPGNLVAIFLPYFQRKNLLLGHQLDPSSLILQELTLCGHEGAHRPWACPDAHLDFNPEFPDARESLKCIQSLDFDTVVLVIQHAAHQSDVIISTSSGLECARRNKRGRRSKQPGSIHHPSSPTPLCCQHPLAQSLPLAARERDISCPLDTVWPTKGGWG